MRNYLISSILLLIALAAPFTVSSDYQISVMTQIAIFAPLAMALNILVGYAGRTSLCHGAVFGVSSYTVLYLVTVHGVSLPLAILSGILASTILAGVFGLISMRVSGVYFLLLTLALGMIVWGVCLRWTSVTGGENGIRGMIRPETVTDPTVFYYCCLAVAITTGFVIARVVKSPFGASLKGIRESESRMRSLGYNVPLHILIGFMLSGFFSGIGGALHALFNGFVSPTTVALSQSVELLLMVIVGGVGTMLGGAVGAAVIIFLQNYVSLYTERWPMVLGVFFVLTVILAPEGIIGKLRRIGRSSGGAAPTKMSEIA